MWSSTLPTGTISNTQRADRTFPRSRQAPENESPQEPSVSSQTNSHQQAAATAEIGRLRAERQEMREEIQQLNAQVESLRSELQRQQEAKQAIVDRYERVISELETAAATAPTTQSAGAERATGRTQTVDGRVIQRLTQWL